MKAKPKTTPLAGRAKRLIVKQSGKTMVVPFFSKSLFQRCIFPVAPRGDRYEWKEVETVFTVPKGGLFVIKIEASCKNAGQNRSTNDDDLRVALDGFDFGKYEVHDEQVSWKGFGTSASFDGASLKGGTKTIYLFTELGKGSHTLQFFADQTPRLKNIKVFEVQDNLFERFDLKPSENIPSDENGIPWLSFVFLGTLPKTISLDVKTKSGKTKKTKDGDNLKVVVNGSILKSPIASTALKYKNFYFSGDLRAQDSLAIPYTQLSRPLAFENAVELWYDEEPEITNLKIEFLTEADIIKYLKQGDVDLEQLKEEIKHSAERALDYFEDHEDIYSAQFLSHALKDNPEPLIFQADDPLIHKIKQDPVYEKILAKIKKKIKSGILEGEIWPVDFKDDPEMRGKINFDSKDLNTSIHGVHKIEYQAEAKNSSQYDVRMVIFDVYDFDKAGPSHLFFWQFIKRLKAKVINKIINRLDTGETLGIIKNYGIKIYLNETLQMD